MTLCIAFFFIFIDILSYSFLTCVHLDIPGLTLSTWNSTFSVCLCSHFLDMLSAGGIQCSNLENLKLDHL